MAVYTKMTTRNGWMATSEFEGWWSWWHETSAELNSANGDLYIRRKGRQGLYRLQTERTDTDIGVPEVLYGKFKTLKAAKIAWLVLRGTS